MEPKLVVDLLRALSLACWAGLGVVAASLIGTGLAYARRWELGDVESFHREALAAFRKDREAMEGLLRESDSETTPRAGTATMSQQPSRMAQGAPPWSTLRKLIKEKSCVSARLLARLPENGAVSHARLKAFAEEIVDAADAHGGRLLAFLFASAPCLGAAGTMSGTMAGLYDIDRGLKAGVAGLPLADLSDALLTTFVACVIVFGSQALRSFVTGAFRARLVERLVAHGTDVCNLLGASRSLSRKLRGRRPRVMTLQEKNDTGVEPAAKEGLARGSAGNREAELTS